MDAVPSGSYLVITHLAGDVYPEVAETARRYNERADNKSVPRDRAECTRFFDGLELAEPGVVPWSEWRPRSELEAAAHAIGWSGVARKPLARRQTSACSPLTAAPGPSTSGSA